MVNATRDLILNCQDIDLEPVEVPLWKDSEGNPLTVYVRQMSGKQADAYILAIKDEEGVRKNIGALICCICNQDGNQMFTKDDIDALYEKNSVALNWLTNKVLEINFKSSQALDEDAKN